MENYSDPIRNEGRCKHYHGENDIVLIKFKCCNKYFPCYKCHDENREHLTQKWKKEEFHKKAILCGACHRELTIDEYLYKKECKYCHSNFNPNCSRHYNIYFDMPSYDTYQVKK
ncbi:CHY zinc finger protein [Oceanobacillus senegalensis]|uniref:CHY zinc finger protein n=1 Tax=Oceanobacillus senegalensis TaxID=1936063 RepID=UPI000A30A27B|nr:CHY zinc finger protein [Oceanobacillus senegalensis]